MATNAELITQLYIGFYNRAPDPAGLEYWLGRMAAGVSIEDIGDSFAASPEASESYAFFSQPGADIDTFLGQVYLNVFGRPIDADGLAYYSARLEAGEDPGSVVTSILGNADTNTGSPDQQYIQNKVDAGLYWAEQATTSGVEIYDENGRLNEAANDSAHGVIETVTSDPASVEESTSGSDDFFNPPTDGGGDITVPDAEYGDLTSTNTDGNLYAGTTNPSDGFMIGKDAGNTMELGLDVRYSGTATEIPPSHDNVFVVDADTGDTVRFAYSVSGIDLATYDYTLQIDTDPGAETNFETFKLVENDGSGGSDAGNPSEYDWVSTSARITDDGGDGAGTVTQNIQAIQWYNDGHGIQGAETYDVNLTATLKGTDTVVAETGIVIQSDAGSQTLAVADTVAGNADGHLFVGQTNPNTGFATVVSEASNIELGLTGWVNQVGTVEGALDSSDGLLHYTLDNADTARFVYSAESQDADLLSANTFRLSIDTDGSSDTNYQVFQLAANGGNTADGANIGDSVYQWDHISGDGPTGSITDDGGDGAIGKVTQNIENVAWFDSETTSETAEPGQYDIMLEAIGADGVTVVGINHIVLDIGPLPT